MEYKSINLKVDDIDRDKRTAVIAHAGYNNTDKLKDISRKGMFAKSWQESKGEIELYRNHRPDEVPGNVVDVWDDNDYAYTKAYFGTHTLGDDTLKMLDEKIIKKASFGFITVRANKLSGGIRELKEVKHLETSVITAGRFVVNPNTKIVSVTKAFEWESCITELKSHLNDMEKFCRNTTASDQCIKSVLNEIKEAKAIISKYDTAFTHAVEETPAPDASNDFSDLLKSLTTFNQTVKN